MISIQPRLATTEEGSPADRFLHCSPVQQDMLSVRIIVRSLRNFQVSRLSPYLRPIERIRALSVEAVLHKLQNYHRQQLALKRLHQVFPEKFQQLYSRKNRAQHPYLHEQIWLDVLQEFLRCVNQAHLLPLDHTIIDDAYRFWMETLDPCDLDQMAEFLTLIPVQSYGFTREGNARKFPAMFLLHYLLADPSTCGKLECQLSEWKPRELSDKIPEIRFAEDVMDRLVAWREWDRQASLLRLAHIQAQPDRWPEPIRHLPLLGNWAAHMTGNVLLDREFDWMEERGGWPFTWDDLDWVQKLAEQARPLVEIMEDRVSEWLAQDGNNRINNLARFVINGQCDYELNW